MNSESRFLAGRRALVTGSVTGLGHAMACALAAVGADIMLTGLESAADLAERCTALAAQYQVAVHYQQADLSQPSGVAALIDAAMARLGGIDVLVNNAVIRHFEPIERLSLEAWNHSLAVNLTSVFLATQRVLPAMRRQDFGRIINMTSVYGSRATTQRIDYVTTKTAIQGMTRATALEVAGSGVSCHALCPGSVLTEAIDERVTALMHSQGLERREAERRFLDGKQPSERFIAESSVTQVLLLLCGPVGPDMNGAIVPIEAGWLAR